MFAQYFASTLFTLCSFLNVESITQKSNQQNQQTPVIINITANVARYPVIISDENQLILLENLEVNQDYEVFLGTSDNRFPKGELIFNNKNQGVNFDFTAKNKNEQLILQSPIKQTLNKEYFLSIRKKIVSAAPPSNSAARSPLSVITTQNGSSATTLIKNVLIGTDCFEISNVQVIGPNTRWGTFANGSTSIGIGTGMVMSSGFLTSIGQPSINTSSDFSTGNYTDPVLGALQDPAVIEFDIKPTTNLLSFDYVFASEEYCAFVNSTFNDKFGFFISGPGIVGNYNMAQINNVPVTINNVNHITNSTYYYSNKTAASSFTGSGCPGHPMGPTTPNPASVNECVFNGFTKVLTAVSPVLQTCQTYHMRLVVGDVGDRALDSGVFLKAGSFSTDSYVVPSIYNATNVGSNIVNEGCENGILKICRPPGADNSFPKAVTWTFTGSTATSGIDYTSFGTSAIIPGGQDCIEIPITVLLDQIQEPDEIIKVTVNEGCKCSPYELIIKDPPPMSVVMNDITVCPNTQVNLSPTVTGGFPNLSYTWNPANTGSTYTFTAGTTPSVTTYAVTVTDQCGHIKSDDAKVTVQGQPTANMSTTNTSVCSGGFSTLNVNFTGTAPWILTYTFNGVAQPPITTSTNPYSITVTQAGTYALSDVKYPGAGGCNGPATGSATVTQSTPTANITPTNVKCKSANDGSITVTPLTGTSPYSYTWSVNAATGNTATANNLVPGAYTVTVTDAGGCSVVKSTSITEPTILVATTSGSTVQTCSTQGSGTVNVTGGTPTYTFLWSNGATGQNISGVSAGTYILTVTDSKGCQDTAKVVINQNTTPPIADATANVTVTCSNPTVQINGSASSSGAGISYNWSGPGIASGGTTANPTVNAGGTYTLTVTNAANGCTAVKTVNVDQNTVLPTAVTVPSPPITCSNPTITVSGVGSSTGSNFTYNWAGAGIVSGGTTLTPTVNAAGTYILTVTDTQNGCTKSASTSVTQNTTLPNADAGTPKTLNCFNNQSVTIGGNSSSGANFTYIWSNGATTPTQTVTTPGTYILTVTDTQNGCKKTAQVVVNEDITPPVISPISPVTINCTNPNPTINTSVTGTNLTYAWLPSGSGANPTVSTPGTYTLTVTNSVNGCKDVKTVVIPEDKVEPTAAIAPPGELNCFNNSTLVLDPSGTSTGANFTYNWSGPSPFSGTSLTPPNATVAGTYTLVVTNTTNGCTKNKSVTITQNTTLPTADAGAPKTLNCFNNQSVTIGGNSSSGANFTYIWSNGATTPTQTVTTPGTYILTVTDTQNGCKKTAQVVVNEDITPPVISLISPVTINCTNPNPIINTSVTGTNLTYAWSPSGSGANPTVSTPGTYTLTVTNSVNGCKDVKTVVIPEDKVEPTVAIAPPGELNCFNNSTLILDPSGTSTGANFTYNWSGPSGFSGTNLTPPNATVAGTYTLVVTNTTNGCTKNKSVTIIQNNTPPTPAAMPPQTLNCYNNGQVTIGGNATGGTSLTYNWSNGVATPTQTVTTPGTYTVTVTNTLNGCTQAANVVISEDKVDPTANAGTPVLINCFNPTVTLTGTAGNGAPLTYAWSGPGITAGGNSLTPSVNLPGTYILTVTNTTNGCTKTAQIDILSDKNPPIATVVPPAQIDCNNPTLTLNGAGSSTGANFTYIWSGAGIASGGTTLNPTINAGGNYTLTVTNTTNGCTKSITVNVVEDKVLPNALAGNPQTINCYNPTLVLNGAGSSLGGNFSYNWTATNGGNITGGGSTLNPAIDKGGIYTLVVTNSSNGCTKSASVSINEDKVAPVIAATGAGTITCTLPALTLGVNITSGSNLAFQWSANPGNITGNSNSQSVVVNQGGNYSVTVTNNTNGCKATDLVVVTANNQLPNVSAIPSGSINCNNSTVTIDGTASSQGANFTYNWTGPNNYQNNSTLSPTISLGGAYTLAIINSSNGCTASKTVLVGEDKTPPGMTILTPEIINCIKPTIIIQAIPQNGNGTNIYSWTTPNGAFVSSQQVQNPVVSKGGTYDLNVINSTNGCQANYSIQVVEDKVLPVVVLQAAGAITCTNPVVTLNALGTSSGPNISFTWTANPGMFISGQNTLQPVVGKIGTYLLAVKNNTNGCEASAQTSVFDNRVYPLLNIATPPELNCILLETNIDASNSSTQNMSFQWSTVGGNIVSGATSLIPKVDKGGSYTLTITDNSNNCTTTKTITVNQNVVKPTANAGPDKLLTCSSTSVQLQGSGSTGTQYVYQWSNTSGAIPANLGGKTFTPTVSQVGSYTLTVTNTTTGCKETSSTNVTLDANVPVANAGLKKEINCNITSVQLDGTGSSQGGNFTFTWSSPNGNFVSGQTTLQPTVDKPGNYNLKVKNTQNGCEGNASVQVEDNRIKPTIAVAAPKMLNCSNPSYALSGAGSSAGANFTYLWTTLGGNFVSGTTTLNPIIDQSGNYTLKIKNSLNGCEKDTTINVISNFNLPVPSALPTALLTCTNPTTILDASGSKKIQNAKFQWVALPGANIVSGANTPKPKVDKDGDYKLILTDTVSLCKDSIIVKVQKDANIPSADAGATAQLNCTVKDITLNGKISTGANISFTWTTLGGNIVSGATTLTPKVNKPGDYTLKVVNATNQCEASSTVKITQDTLKPTVAIAKPAILNCKTTITNLDATKSSQGANFQFTWKTPTGAVVANGNTLSPTVKLPGNYVLTVTNTTNTCTAVNSVNIEQDIVKPQADITKSDTLNCINLKFNIKGKASANSGFYTFKWVAPPSGIIANPNSLEPTINQPGDYQLVVTDTVNYCTSTAQITVIKDVLTPIVSAGTGGNLTCVVKDLLLNGTATNGQSKDLNYAWTTPNGNIVGATNTLKAKVDLPGKYILTVVNKVNGCKSKDSTSVSQDADVPKVEILTNGDLDCKTKDLVLDGSESSQGAGITFSWTTKNGNFVKDQNTLKPTVNSAGVYILQIKNSNNNCIKEIEKTILIDTISPVINIIKDVLTCGKPTVSLEAKVFKANQFTFDWSTATGGILTTKKDTLQISINKKGFYTFIAKNTGNKCESTKTIEVLEDKVLPITDAGATFQINCQDSIITLQGDKSSKGNDFAYNWTTLNGNFLSGEKTLNPKINKSGDYFLLITNKNNGCQNKDTVNISVNKIIPIISFTKPDTLTCKKTVIDLKANATVTGSSGNYSWSTINGNFIGGKTTPSTSVNQTGTYFLQVMDNKNFCKSAKQVDVPIDTIHPIANAGANIELDCKNPTIKVLGNAVGKNLIYEWTSTNGTIVANANKLEVTVNSAGFYKLKVTNTVNGCANEDDMEVTFLGAPKALIAPPKILNCKTTSIVLDANGSDAGTNFSYTWTDVSGKNLGTDKTVNISQPGLYNFKIYNSTNSCEKKLQINVTQDIVKPIVDAGFGGTIDCTKGYVTLDATKSSFGAKYSYQWSGGQIANGGNTLNPKVTAQAIYKLVVTNNENGCVNEDTVGVISLKPALLEVAPKDPLCPGGLGGVLFKSVSGGTPPFTYSVDGGGNFFPNINYTNLRAGKYKAIVQDSKGCRDTLEVKITDPLRMKIDLPSVYNVKIGNDIQLFASVQPTKPALVSIKWSPDSLLSCSDCLDPIVKQPRTDLLYKIKVKNANGCEAEATTNIILDHFIPVYIPNGFSPNGDGSNDKLIVYGNPDLALKVKLFRVFDRWGTMVYEEKDIPVNDLARGWDGTFRGNELNPAVFVWYAEVLLLDGQTKAYKGDVTLYR